MHPDRGRRTRLTRCTVSAGTALALVLAATPGAAARTGDAPDDGLSPADEAVLQTYVADTWASFEAMVDPATGLPADNIGGDLSEDSRSGYTSPTNIGAYLWSTLVARDTGLIDRREATQRLARTLTTVGGLERHDDSGMFYNWYDEATGEKLTTWPVDGNPVEPFLSSVDNGWLATGLLLVENSDPRLRQQARALRESMDFGFYYDAAAKADVGLIRGGFWDSEPSGCSVLDNYSDAGADVFYTCHHYGAFNTEPRMASYLGIMAGQIPAEHYFGPWRTFPDTCDWSWTEQRASGAWETHRGVEVFQGTYGYRGMELVPTWGGSMFEALMVPLFVPEEEWGPDSWGVNHPLTVQAQIEHGMDEAGYGYWGFSPSNNPAGGYREYGVDAIGINPDGYSSDQERTLVDGGYEGCREAAPAPPGYGDGVVTPHASFLALRYAPQEALTNLDNLRTDFDAYGPGGFYDAVAVGSGQVSQQYLSLDQGMVMAALGNALTDDRLRDRASRGRMEAVLRPIMAEETFGSEPRP